jgi:hypothetical protein
MGCYCATGACIPPLFLFQGKRLYQSLLEGAPPGSGLQVNESGWMTEELFYQWLEFFSTSIPPARPALLIVDNHESRFSLRIIERCIEQQIILLLLPPNATHIMQVGDVAVHAPFKRAIRNQVGVFLHQHPRISISKYHYAQIIAPAYAAAFSPSNIQSGYAATGIYPFSPDKVKNHLPSSLSPSPSSSMMPLSEILSIPGQIQEKPSTPRKKRAGMPATRILTSTQMQTFFQEQKQAEEEKETQKLEKKRVREEKKATEAASSKRQYIRKQGPLSDEQKQEEEEKQKQKAEQKRMREEKKAAEAARPKRKYVRKQKPAAAAEPVRAEQGEESGKENVPPQGESDEEMNDAEEEDVSYYPPPSIPPSIPSSSRPSRDAAQLARAQICAAGLCP